MGIKLHFGEEDWERVERDWTAWWAGELERPLVMIEDEAPTSDAALLGLMPWEDFLACSFPLEMPADQLIDHYHERLEARHFYGDAFPRWWPNLGPGIVAAFLGANVECAPTTVWFSPGDEIPIEDLIPEHDPSNVWWRRTQDLTQAAVERWGSQVAVGHTDLGGTLDILASLRKSEQLLLDLYDAPNEVEALARLITRLWQGCYNELDTIIRSRCRGTSGWAPIWSPGRCYMLQCDFSYMISPEMFERFVLPDLEACCHALDHAFYHLDGKGEIPHLDMLLSLEGLHGIQWIPGDGAPPPEAWLPLLRRVRDGGKLCQLYVSPEGARTIVRELGGQGFALYVQHPMDSEKAEAFLRSLR